MKFQIALDIPKVLSVECRHNEEKKSWPEILYKGINFKLTLCESCEIKEQFEPLLGGKLQQ